MFYNYIHIIQYFKIINFQILSYKKMQMMYDTYQKY